MRLVVVSLLIPFTGYARYRGTLTANQSDLNSIGNPFGTGSFFSLRSFGNKQGRHRSSARSLPPSLSVPRMDPVFLERQGRSRTTLGIPQRDPMLVNNPKRRGLCLEDISHTARPPAYCSCY